METQYPELKTRIQSTFIDTIFIVVLMFVFTGLLDKMASPPDWLRVVMFLTLWLVYEPVCTTLGGTIGNRMNGIRVRKSTDLNATINIFQSLLRYVLKLALGWLSFLTIHSSPEKRAIHDLAADSVMIKI
ncbi:RDD family protein [Flavitalea sp.]|nr:RDD family protein [Flavitalea sp.]